jgi:Repeat of unknown function (DUF5648)
MGGFAGTMQRYPRLALCAMVLAGLALAGKAFALDTGNTTISATVLGSPLVIETTAHFAGAISSLTWKGMQFINAHDHGRELQSASSFDGFGECFNPTEAGSVTDMTTSTSQVLSLSVSRNHLNMATQMAFWTPVGSPYPAGCGGNPAYAAAQNTSNLSSHILTKSVTIGYKGISNVVEDLVTFHVPEEHMSGTFESLTGYMPSNFSNFYTFDPRHVALNRLAHTPGEQELPIIFSTPDKNYAMGIYSPDHPQKGYAGLGYGRYDFTPATVKWNSVFRTASTPVGNYSYRDYVVVGNLRQVIEGMISVSKLFHPATASNLVNVNRFFNPTTGEHFFTKSIFEGLSANFSPESIAFRVLASNAGVSDAVPIYRCLAAYGKHFISRQSNCEGHTAEGMYGYVYSTSVSGSLPLYRFYLASTGDHLETTNYNEGVAGGYTLEPTLGYVPPTP